MLRFPPFFKVATPGMIDGAKPEPMRRGSGVGRTIGDGSGVRCLADRSAQKRLGFRRAEGMFTNVAGPALLGGGRRIVIWARGVALIAWQVSAAGFARLGSVGE